LLFANVACVVCHAFLFVFACSGLHLVLHSFPTRRSSDLEGFPGSTELAAIRDVTSRGYTDHQMVDSMNLIHMNGRIYDPELGRLDRKSTRLNSSHVKISYAVFCLKKKKDNLIY